MLVSANFKELQNSLVIYWTLKIFHLIQMEKLAIFDLLHLYSRYTVF